MLVGKASSNDPGIELQTGAVSAVRRILRQCTEASSAAIDQDKEDHRQNMRTVLDLCLPLK